MRNHHLGSLRNFPFSSAVMNTSDPPGTTAHPAQLPVLPVPKAILWTQGAARGLGHPQQHPPIHLWGFVGGFAGISSFKTFVLKNGSKVKGASWTEGWQEDLDLHGQQGLAPASSEPRRSWDCPSPSCSSICPPSVQCAFLPWTWNRAHLPQQQILPWKWSKICLMVLQSCRKFCS